MADEAETPAPESVAEPPTAVEETTAAPEESSAAPEASPGPSPSKAAEHGEPVEDSSADEMEEGLDAEEDELEGEMEEAEEEEGIEVPVDEYGAAEYGGEIPLWPGYISEVTEVTYAGEGEEPSEYYPRPIYYDQDEGEYEVEVVAEEVSGETLSTLPSVLSIASIEETEEERLAREERKRACEAFRQKQFERITLRRKNAFLQKKLVEHFKRRRMDHVCKEEAKGLDQEAKYMKRLYSFHTAKSEAMLERQEITDTLDSLKQLVSDTEQELNTILEALIKRQELLASTLIITKTGKKLNDKVVERLLKRQVAKSEEIGQIRLKYIKIKNLISSKEDALKSLESFGEGLHLMDYEQLRIDSQNYADKLEEKDDELANLRGKASQNIQNLAHVREKAFALEGDIEHMRQNVNRVEEIYSTTRERVSNMKMERDFLRGEKLRLKHQYGLLTNNMLLREFEDSLDEMVEVERAVEELKKAVEEKRRRLSHFQMHTKPVSSFVAFKFPFEIALEAKLREEQELNRGKIRKGSNVSRKSVVSEKNIKK